MPVVRELLGLAATTDLATMRQAFDALARPSLRARETDIAGVRCRVIEPETGTPEAVYVHLHGGGMVAGSAAMADMANEALAERHQVTVVSIDYSLAPERSHPVPVDEACAVALGILDDALQGSGPAAVVLGGESAGAYVRHGNTDPTPATITTSHR